eukprot:8237551-Karenia_brevis.AAC.1
MSSTRSEKRKTMGTLGEVATLIGMSTNGSVQETKAVPATPAIMSTICINAVGYHRQPAQVKGKRHDLLDLSIGVTPWQSRMPLPGPAIHGKATRKHAQQAQP